LEGQQRSVRSDLEKVEKEKEALSEQNKALSGEIKQLQPKLVSAESKSAELLDQLTKVKAERADWEGKFDKAVKDYEKQVAQLTAEKKKAENELQSSLRSVEQKLGRCETNNARLCVIAQELIEKFKNKGVSTSILQIEPFTQIQKVEMENLLEEYMERIEREEMKKAVSKKP
jgi:chromosome segregation ATPase